MDLLYKKRLLYQLSHNHWPSTQFLISNIFFFFWRCFIAKNIVPCGLSLLNPSTYKTDSKCRYQTVEFQTVCLGMFVTNSVTRFGELFCHFEEFFWTYFGEIFYPF